MAKRKQPLMYYEWAALEVLLYGPSIEGISTFVYKEPRKKPGKHKKK